MGFEWAPLYEIATQHEINYGTLRTWSKRYSDFPPPKKINAAGHGILWNVEEVLGWVYHHNNNKKSGGAQYHRDPAKRAELGHKFRRVRNLNKCSDCSASFHFNQEIWEVRNGEDLELLCDPCYRNWTSDVAVSTRVRDL